MKINILWGDLTDISAKKEALAPTRLGTQVAMASSTQAMIHTYTCLTTDKLAQKLLMQVINIVKSPIKSKHPRTHATSWLDQSLLCRQMILFSKSGIMYL